MIYVLEILNQKYIKIGYTKDDIEKRISSLQTGNPFEIKLLFTVDGSILQEKTIHKALDDAMFRMNSSHPPNEWYPGKKPLIVNFLDNLKLYGCNQALSYIDQFSFITKQPSKFKPPIVRKKEWPNPRTKIFTKLEKSLGPVEYINY